MLAGHGREIGEAITLTKVGQLPHRRPQTYTPFSDEGGAKQFHLIALIGAGHTYTANIADAEEGCASGGIWRVLAWGCRAGTGARGVWREDRHKGRLSILACFSEAGSGQPEHDY